MKKVFLFASVAFLAASVLTSCGGSSEGEKATQDSAATQTAVDSLANTMAPAVDTAAAAAPAADTAAKAEEKK
jgi:hypothetical protein